MRIPVVVVGGRGLVTLLCNRADYVVLVAVDIHF